tara:strand:- start:849 stop:1010 length:162 start_codon:yes stop_codon:yes gene_type:complete
MEKEYKLTEKQFLEMLKVIEEHKEWRQQHNQHECECKAMDAQKQRARGRHGCY